MATTPAAEDTNTASRHKRLDIQALRAVAVVLVVLNHVFGRPSGGFVGVDVFYVISGFLITSLLLKEADAGCLSLGRFYLRRVLRLAPAAIIVLIATVTTAYIVWYEPRANQSLLDAIAALFFAENWHLIELGTDYLQASGPISPVQHYWSLSVEEQFYAVWPAAIAVLTAAALRSGLPAKRVLLAAAVFVASGSLIWAARRTGTAPQAAYFDTGARAWELMAGALVAALGRSDRTAYTPALRTIVACGGFAVIAMASVAISSSDPFPFPWALVPVLATAAVLWADVPISVGWYQRLTGNPAVQHTGAISYSLYLWHFPLIVFAETIWGTSTVVRIVSLVAMYLLATASRRWIEQPFIGRTPRPWTAGPNSPRARPKAAVFVVPAGVVTFMVVMAVLQLRGPEPVRDASFLALKMGNHQTTVAGVATQEPSTQQLAAEIRASLRTDSWPASLNPSFDALYSTEQAPAMQTQAPGCRNDVMANLSPPDICRYGRGSRSVMVVGDSVAMSWVPTVQAVFQPRGFGIEAVGYANCSLIDAHYVPRVSPVGFADRCEQKRAVMLSLIKATRPQVLVLSTIQEAISRLTSGATGPSAITEWRDAVSRTLAQVAPYVNRVIILSNPPSAVDPHVCATRVSGPRPCDSPVTQSYDDNVSADTQAVTAAQSAGLNVTFVDTEGWFCAGGTCPLVVGNTIMRFDNSHLTNAGAILVSGAAAQALR